jgi:hypothetical protein
MGVGVVRLFSFALQWPFLTSSHICHPTVTLPK